MSGVDELHRAVISNGKTVEARSELAHWPTAARAAHADESRRLSEAAALAAADPARCRGAAAASTAGSSSAVERSAAAEAAGDALARERDAATARLAAAGEDAARRVDLAMREVSETRAELASSADAVEAVARLEQRNARLDQDLTRESMARRKQCWNQPLV